MLSQWLGVGQGTWIQTIMRNVLRALPTSYIVSTNARFKFTIKLGLCHDNTYQVHSIF